MRALFLKARSRPVFIALRAFRRRLRRDERGIAAVEFALILPLMLMIYLGLVELSRGFRAGQRLDTVSHTLADLTAQILPISKAPIDKCKTDTAPCINEDDVNNIFSAAATLMAPLPTASLKMTITEVNIEGTPVLAPTAWTAKVVWSVARNGGTKRECDVAGLSPAVNPAPYSQDKISASYVQVTNGQAPATGPIIISDISYDYAPGINFELYKWKSSPTWTMKRTSYAAVRNTFVPSHLRYFMTSGTNCNGTTP